ncbi:hypothetical protein CALVIDRAFT_538345 [Calocera viscosa TUFC12733]|uniref:Uncharacterized protein n=1 Tax=Calocera viscosa (strain TUFC12733) TaxID=1330018 RepID=A0A167L0A6_CALVF|nr:hypothetical protein CALVIDRAFT_538345 [Calocera viscosa TUFC12733]
MYYEGPSSDRALGCGLGEDSRDEASSKGESNEGVGEEQRRPSLTFPVSTLGAF